MNIGYIIIPIFFICFFILMYLFKKAPIFNEDEQPLTPEQNVKHEEKKNFWKNKELREMIEKELEQKRFNSKYKKCEKPVIRLKGGLWQKIKSKSKYNKSV